MCPDVLTISGFVTECAIMLKSFNTSAVYSSLEGCSVLPRKPPCLQVWRNITCDFRQDCCDTTIYCASYMIDFYLFKPWNQFKVHLECDWGVYIEHFYSVRTCKSILIAICGFTEKTQLLVWYEEEDDRERKPLFTILLSCKLSIPGIIRSLSLLPRQQEVWPCGDRLPPTPGRRNQFANG